MYPIAPQSRVVRMAPAPHGEPAAAAADGELADADKPADQSGATQAKTLLALMAQAQEAQTRQELLLERQREAFDFMMKQRAELEREQNALQALAMEQRKHDDENLKEWIRMI